MMGITAYWKKFRAKRSLSEGHRLEFRDRQSLNTEDLMLFTPDEMMEATQNFRHIIGQGKQNPAFAKVFFGRLPDGREISVKLFSSTLGIEEFFNEVDSISRVHHKNLVSLLGCCFFQSGEHMLIFDNMSEGFLGDHLYGQRAGLSILNWKSRLKIAIDVSDALQYLHVCCTPMIIHGDVKSSNILLDSDLNGKLVDFGLSMMTMDRKAPIEDTVKGTSGYVDPEYVATGLATQKNDVYSFGVVLLEIICGRHAGKTTFNVRDYVGINENPGKLVEIIDKKMEGTYHMKSITIVAKVALKCLQGSSCRPSISEVAGELKEAFMYEKLNGRAERGFHISESKVES